MAEITSYTAARIQEIENAGIADAAFDVSGNLIITRNDASEINAGTLTMAPLPPGIISMFGGPGGSVPSGWLLCDGDTVSRETFADLFAVIGTAFGSGDGSTTFGLPNFSARFPRGDPALLGTMGGNSTHTHPVGTHSHSSAAHDHQIHGGSMDAVARVMYVSTPAPNTWMERIDTNVWSSTHTADFVNVDNHVDGSRDSGAKVVGITSSRTPGSTGSGGPSDTGAPTYGLPPYLCVNFIIKT